MVEDQYDPDKYNPDYIYSRSSNRYGVAGKTPRVNAPTAVLGAVNSLIQQNKQLGYSSLESFIRDAICHRLHYWRDRLPAMANEIDIGIIAARVESDLAHREIAEKLVHDLVMALNRSMSTEEYEKVQSQVWQAASVIGYKDLRAELLSRCGGKLQKQHATRDGDGE